MSDSSLRKIIYEHARLRALYAKATDNPVPFGIQESDIVVPECCPILKTPISSDPESDGFPYLVRIQLPLGFVNGNVQVVCKAAFRQFKVGVGKPPQQFVEASSLEDISKLMKLFASPADGLAIP